MTTPIRRGGVGLSLAGGEVDGGQSAQFARRRGAVDVGRDTVTHRDHFSKTGGGRKTGWKRGEA